jgi:hypothetical protein
MTQQRFDIHHMDLREVFPWTHLFRGLRIALELKKIVLGAVGAVLMALGWWGIGFFFLPESRVTAPEIPASADAAAVRNHEQESALARFTTIEGVRRFPWEKTDGPDVYRSPLNGGWTERGVPTSFFLVLEPIRRLVLPVELIFRSRGTAGAGILLAVWTLLVWGLFGGAITRIAAVQVAREGRVGPWEALRFAGSRYFNYVGAPVLPFIGVVLIVTLCLIAGFLTRIPGLDVAMGFLWFLTLAAGFVMAVAMLGLALGWPLMYSAISAEATESFDALSRSYSYVLGRPFQYFFYAAVAILYGGLLTAAATSLAYVLVHLSQYAASWGGDESQLRLLYAYAPQAGGWREAFGPAAGGEGPTGTTRITAMLIGFWTHLVLVGLVGFAYSYFWSASTIVYFLLRRDVDETELEEVYVDEEEEEPFPTVAPSLGAPGPGPGPMQPPPGSLTIIDPPR